MLSSDGNERRESELVDCVESVEVEDWLALWLLSRFLRSRCRRFWNHTWI